MAASAAPLPAPSTDPLAALDSHDLQFLPKHLAEAERATDLFKLLLLQRGDDSNAWFAAKPGMDAYLADVTLGQRLAVKQADCAKVISFGLIANSVRSITQLRAPVIETLVNRGLLPLPQAISMCVAAEPPYHVSGLARLLAKIGLPERRRYLREILTTMAVPVRERNVIGGSGGSWKLPLSDGEHIAVISRLAVLPELARDELEQIERAAWLVGERFTGVEAAVAVAEVLADDERVRLLDQAWSVATRFHLFRGRPEAESLVAACAARRGDERYLTDAVDLALTVLGSSEERLKFNDWSPHHGDPGFGRCRLMRLQSFTAPLTVLAPVLEAGRLVGVVRELARRWDGAARMALIALLPRMVELGLRGEAELLFSQQDGATILAACALFATGGRIGNVRAEDVLDSLGGAAEAELKTICLLTLLPALPPERRRAVIENLLRDTEDLGKRSSFRADVLSALIPAIRQLPGELRDELIRRSRQPGDLTRSEDEADKLLDPLVDVWPTELLRRTLDATRRIGLDASLVAGMHRAGPPPSRPRSGAVPDLPGHEASGLSPAEASAALAFAAELGDADKAGALVLLAPFLDDDARRQANGIADTIAAPQLRLEPAVRLAALEPQPDPARLATLLRVLPQVSGGLARLHRVIDLLTALIEPGQAVALRPVLAEVAQDLSNQDLMVLRPVGTRLGEPAYDEQVDLAVARLALWFGDGERQGGHPTGDQQPGGEQPGDQQPGGDRLGGAAGLILDTATAGALLIGEFCRRGEWAVVRSLFAVVRSAADGNEETIAAAEEQITSAPATGSADGRLALLADLVRSAPNRPRRLRALAAALRAALTVPHSGLAAELVADPNVTPGPVGEPDPDLAAAIVAAIDLRLARDDLAGAAAALNGLVTGHAPYRVALGRLASHAADSVTHYLDKAGSPSAPAAEAAFRAYLDFEAAHPNDYMLAEAAGTVLRRRIGAVSAAGPDVPAEWLSRLMSLADADEPGEVLLHQLAVAASCDAAGAAARAGRAGPAAELFQQAYDRWRRYPELDDSTRYLTRATATAAADLRAAGQPSAATRIEGLADAGVS